MLRITSAPWFLATYSARFSCGMSYFSDACTSLPSTASAVYVFHLAFPQSIKVALLLLLSSYFACFEISNKRFQQWAPVSLKLAATSVLQHVGGIHSGCALSGAG